MRITTKRSIWIFDEDAQIVTRVPRSENPVHLSLPYEEIGKPQAYDSLEFREDRQQYRIVIDGEGYWIGVAEKVDA